jgi:hypothetical protein
VQDDVCQRFGLERPSIEFDALPTDISLDAQLIGHATVNPHTARFNQPLCVPPRGDASSRQYLLQPLLSHTGCCEAPGTEDCRFAEAVVSDCARSRAHP